MSNNDFHDADEEYDGGEGDEETKEDLNQKANDTKVVPAVTSNQKDESISEGQDISALANEHDGMHAHEEMKADRSDESEIKQDTVYDMNILKNRLIDEKISENSFKEEAKNEKEKDSLEKSDSMNKNNNSNNNELNREVDTDAPPTTNYQQDQEEEKKAVEQENELVVEFRKLDSKQKQIVVNHMIDFNIESDTNHELIYHGFEDKLKPAGYVIPAKE